jgi:hypothetical protein
MGGGRLDEFGGGRALALGPLGDAVAGDHPDRTDRLDDAAHFLDRDPQPGGFAPIVEAQDRAAIVVLTGAFQELHEDVEDVSRLRLYAISDAEKFRIVECFVPQLEPVTRHFPLPASVFRGRDTSPGSPSPAADSRH